MLIKTLLLLLLSSTLTAKERICLNMIVKNERPVIERSLGSVKDLIDYWVIVDTGSTDGTQEAIQTTLQGIPGELFERPWVNFAHNRNEALKLAKDKGEYLLFLDADDLLHFETSFQLPQLNSGAYEIKWTHQNQAISYWKPQLVNASLPWEWRGVIHEYLFCPTSYTIQKLEGVENWYGGDGARSQDPEKYLKAAAILEEALCQEPQNERYVFYLAASLKDAGKYREAIEQYEKRATMGGWVEEVYWSLLQAAYLKELIGESSEVVIESYYRAFRYRPHRAEAVYFLAQVYNKLQKFDLAYSCIKGWQSLPQKVQSDRLFLIDWIPQYGLPMQLSLAAYYLGHQTEFTSLCKQMLSLPTLPENYRLQVMHNLQFTQID